MTSQPWRPLDNKASLINLHFCGSLKSKDIGAEPVTLTLTLSGSMDFLKSLRKLLKEVIELG